MDVETDPRAAQIPDTPGVHARMLAVPVLGRKEVLGVIELLKYMPDSFSQEDLEIATCSPTTPRWPSRTPGCWSRRPQ
jgi:hypothetical protein